MRHQSYGCFERSADTLFELVDALCSEPQARSLPELSLSLAFRRKWGSVYEALEDGRINEGRWSAVWTAALLGSTRDPSGSALTVAASLALKRKPARIG